MRGKKLLVLLLAVAVLAAGSGCGLLMGVPPSQIGRADLQGTWAGRVTDNSGNTIVVEWGFDGNEYHALSYYRDSDEVMLETGTFAIEGTRIALTGMLAGGGQSEAVSYAIEFSLNGDGLTIKTGANTVTLRKTSHSDLCLVCSAAQDSPAASSPPASSAPVTPIPSETPSGTTQDPPRFEIGPLTPAQVYEDNVDAVFIIYTFDAWGNFAGNGSGFFVNSSGVAVTNHHVMVDAPHAIIITHDGREFDISGYYSYDLSNDLAIIQVEGGNFPFLTMGDSSVLRVGESVFAIGSPFGEQNTFSIGNVSRHVDTLEYDMYKASNLIQITAPISPGSSGGALLNDAGEVIGITTAVHTIGANIGYAVPIDRVNLSGTEGGRHSPLPIGRAVPSGPPGGGQPNVSEYSFASSVPSFGSVSDNAWFLAGGLASDLGFYLGESYNYDYIYVYSLDPRHYVPDAGIYTALLTARGFGYQESMDFEGTVQVYFYKADENISVLHYYSYSDEMIMVAIGRGNALELLLGGITSSPVETSSSYGYDRFPEIPTINTALPGAVFMDEGFAYELGVGENEYIFDDDYVYIYYLAYRTFENDIGSYDDLLEMNGFEILSMGYDEYDDLYFAHFFNWYEQRELVYIYFYEFNVLLIAIT